MARRSNKSGGNDKVFKIIKRVFRHKAIAPNCGIYIGGAIAMSTLMYFLVIMILLRNTPDWGLERYDYYIVFQTLNLPLTPWWAYFSCPIVWQWPLGIMILLSFYQIYWVLAGGFIAVATIWLFSSPIGRKQQKDGLKTAFYRFMAYVILCLLINAGLALIVPVFSPQDHLPQEVFYSKDVIPANVDAKLKLLLEHGDVREQVILSKNDLAFVKKKRNQATGGFIAIAGQLLAVSPHGFEVYLVLEKKDAGYKKSILQTTILFFPFNAITNRKIWNEYQITGTFINKKE